MSKTAEYLKMMVRGIQNPKQVLEGIVTATKLSNGNLPEDEQEEIIRRRVICATCPYMSQNATTSEEYLALSGKHYITEREEAHCSLCYCPIKSKTASLSSNCGIKSFNQDHKTDLELKWTAYVK